MSVVQLNPYLCPPLKTVRNSGILFNKETGLGFELKINFQSSILALFAQFEVDVDQTSFIKCHICSGSNFFDRLVFKKSKNKYFGLSPFASLKIAKNVSKVLAL